MAEFEKFVPEILIQLISNMLQAYSTCSCLHNLFSWWWA